MSRRWYTRPFKPVGDWMVWLALKIFVEGDTWWSFDRSSRTIYARYSEPQSERGLGSEEAFSSMFPFVFVCIYGFSIVAVADALPLSVLILALIVWVAISLGWKDIIGDITVEQEVPHDT